MPKFSIITPTYNRADGRLQRCMTSVLAQVYDDYEHIIVDDGSTDDTEAVCGGDGGGGRGMAMLA
jgi:glycosyltransferase involved in cell wall biosynthesis